MKVLAITSLLCVLALAAAEDFYKIKHNLNLGEAIKNDRLLSSAIKCITEKGPCTASGLELKKIIPEALENNCKRCSPVQKEEAYKAIKYLTVNKPEHWKELEEKFDPEGKFRIAAKNDPFIIKYNIKL